MDLQILVRGRFFPLEGATVKKVALNAWEIRVPRDEAVAKRARRKLSVEAWDGAVFLIDDVETEPAMVSKETSDALFLTALVF